MDAVANEPTTSPVDADTATFTKWLIGEGPNMAGVVGGAAGEGTYSGKVLDMDPGPTTVIAATYRFHGSERPFTALVHVEQTGLEAVITGVVTEGWGKGRPVQGRYDQITCDHDGVTTDCWRGTLDDRVGRGSLTRRIDGTTGAGRGPRTPAPSRRSPASSRPLTRGAHSARDAHAAPQVEEQDDMTLTVRQRIDDQGTGLVGRDQERAFLHQVLGTDGPLVVFIHGIGGVGKSTLVEAFARRGPGPGRDRPSVRLRRHRTDLARVPRCHLDGRRRRPRDG